MANSDLCLLLNLEYMYLVSISFSFFVGLNMNYRVTNISATLLKISSVYSYTRLTKYLRIRAMCFYTSRIMLARLLESALYFSVNVFSARVCRAGHFLHFPVFLRFRVLFRQRGSCHEEPCSHLPLCIQAPP